MLNEFTSIEAQLSKQGCSDKYLVGTQFSAADLSFASLVSPMLLAEQFGGSSLALSKYPTELREFCEKLRARKAGQYALDLYRNHRGKRVIPWSA